MEFSHYAFAFFVFVLVCGAIVLSAAANKYTKKEKLSMERREKKLSLLCHDLEDMTAALEKDIKEARSQTQSEVETCRAALSVATEALQQAHAEMQALLEKSRQGETRRTTAPEPIGPETDESKSGAVLRLDGQGRNVEEIAKALNISRGEVALILGIRKSKP